MAGYLKMSSFKKIARLYADYRLVGHDAQGNNIQISFKDFWNQLDIEAIGGGQPIFFEGTQLPSVNNTGEPLQKGDWLFLPQGATYTNIGGGANIAAPESRLSFGIYNGATWSLKDMGEIPKGDNKIENWTAKVYAAGQQVLEDGKMWEAVVNTTAEQKPGVVAETIWKLAIKGAELNTEVQPNDTTKAPSGKAVTDYVEGKFEEVKTDNLLDLNEVETGKRISFGGVIQSGTGVISGYIPVEAGKTYRIIGRKGAYDTAFYGLYDVNKGGISGHSVVQTITVPELSPVRFIRYHLPKDLDFEGCMFVEGDRYIPYISNSLPKNTSDFLTKKDAIPFEDLNPNQNLYFGSFKKEGELSNLIYREDAFMLVNEEDEILKSYGIEKSLVHFNNAFGAFIGFSSSFAETDKIKYLTMSIILSTDDEGWEDRTSRTQIKVNGVVLDSNGRIVKSYIEISTGVYLVTSVSLLPEIPISSVEASMFFGMKSSAENISKYSGFSFALTEEPIQSPLLKPLLLKDKVRKYLNDSIIYWNDSVSRYIDKGTKNKKVCLYGTSIEAGGYFDKVAEVYEFDYHNFGNGGGGITWSNDNSWWGSNVVNVQKSWSATIAEKQAYCLANGIAFGQKEIDDCYETNLLGNLDADLFIIGTYGINDNARTGLEIDKVNRKYDRTTIYGAYCYVLRKLFEAKPTARVIIFGMHSYTWQSNYAVNTIIAEVAKDWNIPFLDWGRHLGFSTEIVNGSAGETTVVKNAYAADGIHPNAEGRRIMAEYLIRQLRNYV